MSRTFEVVPEWVHVTHVESGEFREVYGFAGGGHGLVNLEGIRLLPKDRPSRTLVVYMHPASTLQLLPLPRAMVERGVHVLCAGSRYARNDSSLIMEKVLLDLGAYLRRAKDVWGYERIVLAGWSGGGSLSLFYQSQAETPTITHTPAGDPVDIVGAKLVAADAMLLQAAHVSRALMLREWIDPSVRDEHDPDDRDPELDLYNPRNPNQPPYTPDFLQRFREAQLARIRRRTAWVKDTLTGLQRAGGLEKERGFVTHRTMADPRFLDGVNRVERSRDRELLSRPSRDREQRPGGSGSVFHTACLAVAVVDRRYERARRTLRGSGHGAAPRDREHGGRRGAAIARRAPA